MENKNNQVGCLALPFLFIGAAMLLSGVFVGVQDGFDLLEIIFILLGSVLIFVGYKFQSKFKRKVDEINQNELLEKKEIETRKKLSEERERQRAEQEKLEAQQRNNKLNRLKYDFNKKHKKKGSGFVEIIDYRN